MRLLAILIISALLFACAASNYSATIHSWDGADANMLIRQWGKPLEKIVTPDQTTYVFMTETWQPTAAYPPTQNYVMVVNHAGKTIGIALPQPNMRSDYSMYRCTTSFVANKNNVIVSSTYQGACYARDGLARVNP